MRLNEDAPIKYSDRETTLFAIIAKSKDSIDTLEITKKFYGDNTIPMNGSKIVLGALSSLRKKVDLNAEPFRILSSKRTGPIPVNFWIESRKVKARA